MDLFSPGDWRPLAEGAGFTEGPVRRDDEIVFVSINRGLLYRVPLAGGPHTRLMEVGSGPNGLALDAHGHLWVAQSGGRVMASRSWTVPPSVQVVSRDAVHMVSPSGHTFHAPNDCAFGPDGRLYVTDPHRRSRDDPSEEPRGRVWALDPASGALELVADGLAHPNGLCFTVEGDLLFSTTADARILRLSLSSGGSLAHPVPHADVPVGAPDGIALDEAGRLWVTTTAGDALAILDPDGTWEVVELGSTFPTNVCFAGEDRRTVVVTAARGGRVIARKVDVPGLSLYAPQTTDGAPPASFDARSR